MANEVIIEEYSSAGLTNSEGKNVPIPGTFITSQIKDIATASSAFDAKTAFIRIQSKGTGFWYILGGNSPDAVANTAGNRWLPPDQFRDIAVRPGTDLKLDTAA